MRISILKQFDWFLFGTIILLLTLGLITQYSLSLTARETEKPLFVKQLIFVLFGLGLFFLISFLDYRALNSYIYIFYGLLLILLFSTLIFGQTFRGTKGWLFLPFFNLYFQPVELTKLILIIVLAKCWSEKKSKQIKNLIIGTLLFLFPFFLVFCQPDLGSAFILIILWLGMLFISFGYSLFFREEGIWTRIKKSIYGFLILLFIFILFSGVWLFLLKDYQKERILIFLNPQRDPLGRGYQITQAIITIGSGKFLGRGLGLGPQSQLHFLPEVRTDFIFTVLAEELGFLGVFFLLGLFIFLFYRILVIAKLTYDNFSLLLVLGLGFLLFSQIFINLSTNLGFVPVIGIPLPFLSYGGSALLTNLIAAGLLESIKIHQEKIGAVKL